MGAVWGEERWERGERGERGEREKGEVREERGGRGEMVTDYYYSATHTKHSKQQLS